MDKECENNTTNLTEKEKALKKSIEKYVRNTDKYKELENIEYSTTRTELNEIDLIEFQGIEYIAEEVCMNVLIDAVSIANARSDSVRYFVEIDEKFYNNDETNEDAFKWPQIREFDLNKFRFLLNDYISHWNLLSGIKYCIQYQSSRTTDVSNFHHFLVIFSIPTKACPNPQAVAYVYFTVETCTCLPDTKPIFVTYKFEQYFKTYVADNNFVFQDMLIKLVLISKSRFYESLNF